jgi:RNA polymerase sigma-70 factor, ECF subfamily
MQDEEDASEVTREAFVAAWQGLPSFRGEARFASLSPSHRLPLLFAIA